MDSNRVMTFGKQTEIRIEQIRGWSWKKFEEKFTEAFQKEYGTAPDFDLKQAYERIQHELGISTLPIPEKTVKPKFHKK